MFSLKPILFFAAKVFIAFLLLTILFNWWGTSFTNTINTVNTYVLGNYGSNGLIRFRLNNPKKDSFQVRMEILSKKLIREAQLSAKEGERIKTIKSVNYQFDAWLFATFPMIVVLSFIFASPVPPKQMLKAVVLALIITQLFVILKIGITITNETYRHAWLQIDDSWWQVIFANPSATDALKDIFKFVGFSLIIAVITWVGVTFNAKDWKRFSRIMDDMGV